MNDHDRKLRVAAIREQKAFLALPQEAFDLALPTLGANPLQVLEDEISATSDALWDARPINPSSGYLDEWQTARNEIMYPRIYRLSSANGGFETGIQLLVLEQSQEISWVQDREKDEMHTLGDERLRAMVEQYVDACSKQGVRWSASRCVDLIPQIGESLGDGGMFTTSHLLDGWFNRTRDQTSGPRR